MREYLIAFGMGPGRLHDELNGQGFPCTRQEARGLFDTYCTKFKTMVQFLRDSGKLAAKQGYLSNLNGRRRFWKIPDPAAFPKGKYDQDYIGKISKVEREGGNFLIQSVNADITKKAMIDIRRYKKDNGIRTSFVNAIYDEVVTRTHKDDSPSFHAEKLRIMQASGEYWIKTVPMLVDGSVNKFWTKD